MTPTRVRQDQPTIRTLEEAMSDAVYWARRAFTNAGFTRVELVITVVASSHDPDDDHTRWTAASRIPDRCDPMLTKTLHLSAEEAEHESTTRTGAHD